MQITIYLHIGESKTGTSIIQNFLNVNRQKLVKDVGYLYPNFSSESFIRGRCHNHADWYYSSIKNDTTNFLEDTHALLQYCQSKGIENILLSNEGWLLSKKTMVIFIPTFLLSPLSEEDVITTQIGIILPLEMTHQNFSRICILCFNFVSKIRSRISF